jgi:hypothetical protein
MMKRLEPAVLVLCAVVLVVSITSSQFSLPAFSNLSLSTDKDIYLLNETVNGAVGAIPQLSDQTLEIETDLTVIDVQSYPSLGGNWTVRFETVGQADLRITAMDGTVFGEDLEFLEVRCGVETLEYSRIDGSLFIPYYSCNETGYEVSKVLTAGKHTLQFGFGYEIVYAYNLAGTNSSTTNLTIWDDTDYGTKYPNEQVYFYANYTNSSTGEPINDTWVYCEFKENSTGSWSSPVNMTFNPTSLLYEYNKSFSASGPLYFNVLCNGSALGYDILNVSDDTNIGFQCDSGTLATTCNITTTHTLYDQGVVSGSGNMVIQNGGEFTTSAGDRFTLNMTGYVTIQSGGSITGNVNLTAANLTIESGGEINVDGRGYGTDSGPGKGSVGTGGSPYGSLTAPDDLGSGGADGSKDSDED